MMHYDSSDTDWVVGGIEPCGCAWAKTAWCLDERTCEEHTNYTARQRKGRRR